MLTDKRLPDLLDSQRQLSSDIANLDSDMQMLVYQNYSKFITATDIIRSMSTHIDSLDTKVQGLDSLMGGIVGKSNQISDSLGERQEEIEQLTNARLVLHRLKAALDIPRKIKAAVRAGALDIAADAYADVLPLLKAHGDRAALKAMAAQTEILRGEVAEKLKQRLTTQPEEAADCVQSLAKLGEPIDSLQNHFLDCSKIKMHTILAKLDNIDNNNSNNNNNMDGSATIARYSHAFFDELQHISRVFLELFNASSGRPQLLIMARECLVGYIKRVKACLLSASSKATAAAAGMLIELEGGGGGASMKVKLHQASLDILTNVNSLPSLHHNKRKVTLSSSSMMEINKNNNANSNSSNTEPALLLLASSVQATFLDSWGAESLLQLLTIIRSDLYRIQQSVPFSSPAAGGAAAGGADTTASYGSNVNCALPELAAGDRAAEIVEATVRGHVGSTFTALRQRLHATISTTIEQAITVSNSAADNDNDDNTLVGLLLVNALAVKTGSQKLLKNLRVFYNNDSSSSNSEEGGGNWVLGAWSDIFASTLHAQLQEVVMSIITALNIDNNNNNDNNNDSKGRVLNFKRALCGIFSKGCSKQLEAQLHQLHPNGSGYSSSLVGNQFDRLATDLLGRYKEMKNQGIVAAVKGATAGGGMEEEEGGVEWANFDEEEDKSGQPASSSRGVGVGKRPSEMATQIATKLKSTLQEMEDMDALVLLPALQALDKLSNTTTTTTITATDANDMAMKREGDEMKETEREVLIAVAHAGLTTYLDRLRREGSFSRMGFQQVQLDAHWLRGRLSDMLFKHDSSSSSSGGGGGGDDGNNSRGTGVAVIQMLDDVVAAAAERCSEPRMLEVAALDRIITALHNNNSV
jgi:hypothetical protein